MAKKKQGSGSPVEKKETKSEKPKMVKVRRIPSNRIFTYNEEIAQRLVKKGVGEIVRVEVTVKEEETEKPENENPAGSPPPKPNAREENKSIL